MGLQLEADLEERIDSMVSAGGFGSADELIRKALDSLSSDEQELERERRAIREDLDRRYEALASGAEQAVPGDEAFERLHARLDRLRSQQ